MEWQGDVPGHEEGMSDVLCAKYARSVVNHPSYTGGELSTQGLVPS